MNHRDPVSVGFLCPDTGLMKLPAHKQSLVLQDFRELRVFLQNP